VVRNLLFHNVFEDTRTILLRFLRELIISGSNWTDIKSCQQNVVQRSIRMLRLCGGVLSLADGRMDVSHMPGLYPFSRNAITTQLVILAAKSYFELLDDIHDIHVPFTADLLYAC
jgi:hypothetical protein